MLFVSGLEVQTRCKTHNFYNNVIRPHNLEGHRHPAQRVDYLQSLSAWFYSLQNLAKVRAQLLSEILINDEAGLFDYARVDKKAVEAEAEASIAVGS